MKTRIKLEGDNCTTSLITNNSLLIWERNKCANLGGGGGRGAGRAGVSAFGDPHPKIASVFGDGGSAKSLAFWGPRVLGISYWGCVEGEIASVLGMWGGRNR